MIKILLSYLNLIFFCSNEVPPAVSKRISLNVNCKELYDIKQNQNIIFIYMVVLAFFLKKT